LRGEPGAIVARRDGAICRATSDGAVWIPQLRVRLAPGGPKTFKLPATLAAGAVLAGVPEVAAPLTLPPGRLTYQETRYRERGGVGYLESAFPGGAMSTGQCRRLLAAWRHAQARPVKVIVLGGPRDFFSNGIHLNVIQAADDPAAESWANINAMNDLVHAAGRLPRRRVGHHAPQLLRTARALPPAAPRLRLQGEAIAHPGPPGPAPNPPLPVPSRAAQVTADTERPGPPAAGRRRPDVNTAVTFMDCPADMDRHGTERCGLPAAVECRYTLSSVEGPLESAHEVFLGGWHRRAWRVTASRGACSPTPADWTSTCLTASTRSGRCPPRRHLGGCTARARAR
jgi:hypothetical protein